ncbi:hypothetical protein EON65_04060 [archaeon]|nr:MAG: hypothetical protein EON65_04060 [archaeon]
MSTYSRVHYDRNHSEDIYRQFLDEACPAQGFSNNCYYHDGDPYSDAPPSNRSKLLELREFVSDDNSCMTFYPHEFLNLIKGRRIVMIGDSLTSEVWRSLVCHLYKVTAMDVKLQWTHAPRYLRNSINYQKFLCPFDKFHCVNPHEGDAFIPHSNTSLHIRDFILFRGGELSSILNSLKLRNGYDIVIFNFGLHYSDRLEFNHAFERLMLELSEYEQAHDSLPIFIVRESTPQHFPILPNGYYTKEIYKIDSCGYVDPEKIRQGDWRNQVAIDLINRHNRNSAWHIGILRVAEGLYSQWDAHVAIGPMLRGFRPPDCSHWCQPGGVHRYLLTMIANALQEELGKFHGRLPTASAVHLPYPDKTLLNCSSGLYLIDHAIKFHFVNSQTFDLMGYDWRLVKQVHDADNGLDNYPTGSPFIL